jgi:hypothetical protein
LQLAVRYVNVIVLSLLLYFTTENIAVAEDKNSFHGLRSQRPGPAARRAQQPYEE